MSGFSLNVNSSKPYIMAFTMKKISPPSEAELGEQAYTAFLQRVQDTFLLVSYKR